MRLLVTLFRTQLRAASTHIAKAGSQGPPLPPLKAVKAKRETQTMLKHIYDTQQKFPGAVVMTQVGAFMELYFDQAVEYGPKLNLKVARKNQNSPIKGQAFVNMAGFPLQHKEKYERIIVNDWGKTVVTLMQDSRHILQGGTEAEKRPVARVLTPGTLLGESFVDMTVNNYLCSIRLIPATQNDGNNGACSMWVDVASGLVKYELVDSPDLGNALTRISPSEVLINKSGNSSSLIDLHEIVATYAPQAALTVHKFPPIEWWNTRTTTRQRFGIESSGEGPARAFVGSVSYIDECMPGSKLEVQEPERFFSSKTMQLDARARDALELTATTDSGFRRGAKSAKGSLLSVIRRTQTISGARLLQEWLVAPLQSPKEIIERQEKVRFFLDLSRADLVSIQTSLSDSPDGTRIIQKLWQPKVDPLDLMAFARSVQVFHHLQKQLTKSKNVPNDWKETLSTLKTKPVSFAKKVTKSINMSALVATDVESVDTSSIENDLNAANAETSGTSTGKISKRTGSRRGPAASPVTGMSPATNRDYIPVSDPMISAGSRKIYDREAGFSEREEKILDRSRKTYGPSVDLRWSPSYQFYVHLITNGANEPEPERSSSRSKKTAYVSDSEWTQLGEERLRLSNDLREEEERILNEMRTDILTDHASLMRKLYSLGDEIDVLMSFAVLALEKRLVCPTIVEDAGVYEVEKGRHITVETGLATGGFASSGFVANDCNLSEPKPVCMITGPNMGGKSTFIRQNAIITILAHIGSFVPARSAKIGVVDRIFCRLGAGDDLYNGRSTFMMEMLETAVILNSATNRSLAILDEVGRGTSSKDGVAIAYACIKHLTLNKQCRTLFATHYGEEIWSVLNHQKEREAVMNGIRSSQASLTVEETDKTRDNKGSNVRITKRIRFDYELKPGISTSSCGSLIADIAGFPSSALEDATNVAAIHASP